MVGLSLCTTPGFPSSWACLGPAPSILQDGGVKGGSADQVPSPRPPTLSLAARPGERLSRPEASLRGSAIPPPAAQMAAGVRVGALAFPLPPPTSVVCHGRKPTPGRAPGGRGFLKFSPPRHTAASGPPPVCAQGLGCLVDCCYREARAVTRSMMGLRKGKVPTHLHASGVHESLGTPWRPFPLSLGSPHPSAAITPCGLGGGWHRGTSAARSASADIGVPARGSEDLNKNSNSCLSSTFLF